jgi:predicted choloylglycine hydrolase
VIVTRQEGLIGELEMKRKKKILILISMLLTVSLLTVVYRETEKMETDASQKIEATQGTQGDEELSTENNTVVTVTKEITELEDGFSAVRYDGNYGFDEYLDQGGAVSDSEVIKFLAKNLLLGAADLEFQSDLFGCSTISVRSPEGDMLFGRNFDWDKCKAMVVSSKPANGYASISTVNMDFISRVNRGAMALLPSKLLTIASLYAPLDGMNERGLSVAVNMIQDSATIEQNTDKPDITTTTVVRLLLNKAANVEEALTLLEKYDMHASMGMMVHFALADAGGRSVVVEYIDNKMIVTETPVVTNFYLAQGKKNGIGTAQSHTRYDMLMKQLSETPTMTIGKVRDSLDSVSKDNFGEFESTEWSIIYNQSSGEVRYYHRENYKRSYTFHIK